MKIQEIWAKSILSKSRIYDYTINPYVGCSHACRYCYAGHKEKWGEFVDVKINAPELLAREIARRPKGRVWVSGVCDPYQQAEKKYRLTRGCMEILIGNGWPVTVQTKSSLVLRDADILERSKEAEVGFTITTADEKIRRMFEPGASPVQERIDALGTLHSKGIRTFAMIAPVLPGAEGLVEQLAGKVDHVLVDRLNYHYADRLYKEKGMDWAMDEPFFFQAADELRTGFEAQGVPVQVLY
jgi:DNA repair photolyase